MTWVGRIAIGLVIAFFAFRIVQMAIKLPTLSKERRASTPGYEQLLAAEKIIVSKRNGIAHGNSAEASKLAQAVSKEMRVMREAMFEKGKGSEAMLTGGDFIVFCELHEASCAFIIHVPELRRFTSEAKESMMDLAYTVACDALDDLEGTRPRRLAVGTKGAMFYDRILIGDYTPNDEKPLAKAKPVDLSEKKTVPSALLPFFVPE
jgi:hypothetical protein